MRIAECRCRGSHDRAPGRVLGNGRRTDDTLSWMMSGISLPPASMYFGRPWFTRLSSKVPRMMRPEAMPEYALIRVMPMNSLPPVLGLVGVGTTALVAVTIGARLN